MMRKILLIAVFLIYNITIFGQQTVKLQLDYFDLLSTLNNYKNGINESYHLTRTWVFIDRLPNTISKYRLIEFHKNGIVQLNEKLNSYEFLYDTLDRAILSIVKSESNRFLEEQKFIMSMLDKFDSYDDPGIVFEIQPRVEDQGDLSYFKDSIINNLNRLIYKKKLEYIDLVERQAVNQPLIETPKIKKIKELLHLLHSSDEIKEILAINNNSSLSRKYLEKDILEILIIKYDKYYSLKEIDDLISFYKTKT